MLGGKYAFWTTLDRVVKEVPKYDLLWVLIDANADTGRRAGGKKGSEQFNVFVSNGQSTLIDNAKHM